MIRAMLQVLVVFAAAAGLSAQSKNYWWTPGRTSRSA